MNIKYILCINILIILLINSFLSIAQPGDPLLNNRRISGYRGIWFELGQKSEYGDKYSGGLGTYTAKHIPMAVYANAVEKTFFVFGGTTGADERHLLCMIGYYDHKTGQVPKPVVVFDKNGVNDPHDNPSLLIDPEGFLWVFVSGRGTGRPGYKFKSVRPYNIDSFEQISVEDMTYPQPWWVENTGIIHLFTKYTGIRELYYETSPDGRIWTEDRKLAGIHETGDEFGGHYQVSNCTGGKVATFFNRHPNGNVDLRTDLYYMQTTDFGMTWTTAGGTPLTVPVSRVASPALVADYASRGRNVYLKDLNFDDSGNPACLYLTSTGHRPGPGNIPYKWLVTRWTGKNWTTAVVCASDHNYDMGSLYTNGPEWLVIAPTTGYPQAWATGGEVVMWASVDKGRSWFVKHTVTRNSRMNHTYIRRPVNARDPFLYFWADGNPGKLTRSTLYFGNSGGKVWRLPYEMDSDLATPEAVSFR